MAAMSDWDRVLKYWPALEWQHRRDDQERRATALGGRRLGRLATASRLGHVPDDPFDPTPWFSMFYNDVDLDAIDWADEMRKLPGQFTQRLYFPGSPDQRIIAEGVYEMTGATL